MLCGEHLIKTKPLACNGPLPGQAFTGTDEGLEDVPPLYNKQWSIDLYYLVSKERVQAREAWEKVQGEHKIKPCDTKV